MCCFRRSFHPTCCSHVHFELRSLIVCGNARIFLLAVPFKCSKSTCWSITTVEINSWSIEQHCTTGWPGPLGPVSESSSAAARPGRGRPGGVRRQSSLESKVRPSQQYHLLFHCNKWTRAGSAAGDQWPRQSRFKWTKLRPSPGPAGRASDNDTTCCYIAINCHVQMALPGWRAPGRR